MNVGTQGKQIAVATAAPPTYGQGDAVPLSTDLSGNLRIGSGLGALPAQQWIAEPYQGQGTITAPTQWPGFGFLVGGAQIPVQVFQHFGSAISVSTVVNEIKYILVKPSAISRDLWLFRPIGIAGNVLTSLDFVPAYPAQIAVPAPSIPAPLAWTIQGRLRKVAAGDATAARQAFGFSIQLNVNPGKEIAQVGLFGDGLLGFRFGSLNCPDGSPVAVQNAANDIDANAVQPAALVNPLALEFGVKIKMIPATPTGGAAAVACYLNNVLQATFLTNVNWPRSAGGGGAGLPLPYAGIAPFFGIFNNPDGVTVDPGYYLRDLRVSYDTDLSI